MSEPIYGGMRRFRLDRREDVTGVSGTGCVAQGVVFSDGTVAMRWMTEHKSTCLYSGISEVEAIHLHHGATVIRWEDPICSACGAAQEYHEIAARHCYACGAGQAAEPFMETRPDPSLGTWAPALVIGAPPAPSEETTEPALPLGHAPMMGDSGCEALVAGRVEDSRFPTVASLPTVRRCGQSLPSHYPPPTTSEGR